jgi:hypothetical protein
MHWHESGIANQPWPPRTWAIFTTLKAGSAIGDLQRTSPYNKRLRRSWPRANDWLLPVRLPLHTGKQVLFESIADQSGLLVAHGASVDGCTAASLRRLMAKIVLVF